MTDDILEIALAWHDAGRAVAIATVVDTWGSAPRGVGSMMVVDETGAMEGSVSGGCVEAAVVTEALDAVKDAQSRLRTYGVADDDAFAVGLACGGTIRILVEPVGSVFPVDVLRALVAAKQQRQPAAYVTSVTQGGGQIAPPNAYADRLRLDRSGIEPDGDTFVAVQSPDVRLIIIGAVHIAQSLVAMARACGFAPIVVDPRSAFASEARFGQTELIIAWPDEVMTDLQLDARTAVVTLAHDPKLDDPALLAALASDAFYIGALGSTRTHAKRVARLQAAGVGDDQIARINGPVGLTLGGRAPAEIAVSILAQMVKTLRQSI